MSKTTSGLSRRTASGMSPKTIEQARARLAAAVANEDVHEMVNTSDGAGVVAAALRRHEETRPQALEWTRLAWDAARAGGLSLNELNRQGRLAAPGDNQHTLAAGRGPDAHPDLTYSDLGFRNHHRPARWRRLAEVPDEEYERYWVQLTPDEWPAWSGLRSPRDDSSRGASPTGGDLDIRHGDFREVLADIPDGSVPLILTDPPYADENVPLYVDLAAFAAAKLEDGGSLICYTGHTILPLVLPVMSDLLRYWWLLALDHQSGTRQLPGKWVRAGWKPVMWFVKDHRRDQNFVRDVIRGTKPDKTDHGWAQGVDEVLPLIEDLTQPGELVVDPFTGSGSFGIAAMKAGRRFLGAEIGS